MRAPGRACAGGATFPCHLPSSLNASAIMINLSGTYEYADEALVSRLCFQERLRVMGSLPPLPSSEEKCHVPGLKINK